MQPTRDAAGRTRSGHLAHVDARRAGEHARPPFEARVEVVDVDVARPLLRTEDASRSTLADERVRHVHGEAPPHGARLRVQPTQVEPRDVREPFAAVGHGLAVLPQRTHAERTQDAGPAVGRRRPAQTHEDLLGPGVERLAQHQPRAEGGREQRLGQHVRDSREPARLRQLDDGEAPVRGRRPPRRRRASERVDRLRTALLHAPGGRERVERALPAVGHRKPYDLRVGPRAEHPVGQELRHVGGGGRSLERVRGHHHPGRRARGLPVLDVGAHARDPIDRLPNTPP